MTTSTNKTRRIVLASGNAGKLREFSALLAGSGFEFVRQSDLHVPEADETGLTFVENAIIKARNAAEHTGLPALADDSGLEVDALAGEPGIYSSRYAGPGGDNGANVIKLLAALKDVPHAERTARFRCLIVYLRHAADPTPLICQGTWEGHILDAPRGNGGFGYDPVFLVPSYECSAAELPAKIKNQLSHRGQAMTALLSAFSAARS
ncbi:MAG: RdgB/HAM1 family non-canonical purine NTP pyrophosphatase [Chromatiales bacterium]|jgi:XTP/dITP diphosphohydrolase|nr:RdgB/HAM1 family non-canonical purine NTP pyrophosphatase [Chromatiales bacterium]